MDDAIALLDSQVDRPVVVYGHSLGAMVAAGVAARLPDRIAAVILEDPPLQTMGDRIEQTSLLSLFTAMQLFAGDSRGVAEIASELGDRLIHDPARGTYRRLGELRDAVSLRFTASCLQQLDSSVLDPIIRGEWMHGYETESIFRSLKCPCLLIQADPAAGGMLIDVDAQSLETWTRELVRVKLTDCGHVIHWNQTLSLLNHVHGFLESIMINN